MAKPPRNGYKLVFDGELGTTNLESIFSTFNCNCPDGYTGRSMTVSDVIELCHDTMSQYFFCDTFGFENIDF